ncbi:hypothetical protein T439DRAFT_326980 [Meredithblackwellia eburnea MCA 4105]
MLDEVNDSLSSYGAAGEYIDGVGVGLARRSSCPAGFIPQFDALGVSSPPHGPVSSQQGNIPPLPTTTTTTGQGQTFWTSSYQPIHNPQSVDNNVQHYISPLASMKRHSIAVPSSYHSSVSPFGQPPPPSIFPVANSNNNSNNNANANNGTSTASPYYSSPQFLPPTTLNGRRGSTSTGAAPLGTIVEALSPQPDHVVGDSGTFPHPHPHPHSPTETETFHNTQQQEVSSSSVVGVARKSRSQASLRASSSVGPYPTTAGERSSSRSSPSVHLERRGSLPQQQQISGLGNNNNMPPVPSTSEMGSSVSPPLQQVMQQ